MPPSEKYSLRSQLSSEEGGPAFLVTIEDSWRAEFLRRSFKKCLIKKGAS